MQILTRLHFMRRPVSLTEACGRPCDVLPILRPRKTTAQQIAPLATNNGCTQRPHGAHTGAEGRSNLNRCFVGPPQTPPKKNTLGPETKPALEQRGPQPSAGPSPHLSCGGHWPTQGKAPTSAPSFETQHNARPESPHGPPTGDATHPHAAPHAPHAHVPRVPWHMRVGVGGPSLPVTRGQGPEERLVRPDGEYKSLRRRCALPFGGGGGAWHGAMVCLWRRPLASRHCTF